MNGKRILMIMLAVVITAGFNTMTAFADTNKKIRTVKLGITADIIPNDPIIFQPVEITADNNRYEVSYYEFLNSGDEWSDSDVPRLVITLNSVSEYYFETADYGFFIDGGIYVSQIKEAEVEDDDNEWKRTLRVVVDLNPVSEYTQAIEYAQWRDDHTVSWTNSVGAGIYEVRLYRNGTRIGTIKKTDETTMDLADFMFRTGSYFVRVRPVNKTNAAIKGKWVESSTVYVDVHAASLNPALPEEKEG